MVFTDNLCWPLLKVHFAGHAHVKLVLDVGMWVTDWECGSLVTNYPRTSPYDGSVKSADPLRFEINKSTNYTLLDKKIST